MAAKPAGQGGKLQTSSGGLSRALHASINTVLAFECPAGGVGATVGSVLSVVQQQPLVRFTALSTASFLMLTGCFSGVWLWIWV